MRVTHAHSSWVDAKWQRPILNPPRGSVNPRRISKKLRIDKAMSRSDHANLGGAATMGGLAPAANTWLTCLMYRVLKRSFFVCSPPYDSRRDIKRSCWIASVRQCVRVRLSVCLYVLHGGPKFLTQFLHAWFYQILTDWRNYFTVRVRKYVIILLQKNPTIAQVCPYTALWNVECLKSKLKTRRLL